ncbi:MAG: hypothetical protein IPL50_16905 [Chitinophagaceae bacterium]|nr:hypothetical protein [Chitinophagaceae bacterium]
METNQSLLNTELQIDSTAQAHPLKQPSGVLFGIVGFIFSGFIAIVALPAGTILRPLQSDFGGGSSIAGAGTATYHLPADRCPVFFMSLVLFRLHPK